MTDGNINPYLVNGNDYQKNLMTAFEDYKPQVNVMPRIAFSFPISDIALFFAHYDVLTQRPGGNNIINPMDYLYLRDIAGSRILSNPNLKSTKTVDYELGFQQVISKTSSIKITTFYRQMEDQIQIRNYAQAYPVTYRTYDNLDFGTVKGLSITYDLRRTGNIRLNASYTLQFAEGTGSSATTALALINAGQPNLKTVNPLSFDKRHRIVLTFDYRYGRGPSYNGPMIGSSQILADFGINVIGDFATGTPYSDSKRVSSLYEGNGGNRLNGTINGSRLPSTFRIDLQVDKSFPIKLGTKEDGGRKMGNLNVYFWFTNILNKKNIVNVYRYTGDPQDDGYLASPRGIQDAENRLSQASFENYYSMSEKTPFNFGLPATIRLGVRFDF
jgi:outer membrane receptor protein involved in Fe transport